MATWSLLGGNLWSPGSVIGGGTSCDRPGRTRKSPVSRLVETWPTSVSKRDKSRTRFKDENRLRSGTQPAFTVSRYALHCGDSPRSFTIVARKRLPLPWPNNDNKNNNNNNDNSSNDHYV
jgi:hypothetical protein